MIPVHLSYLLELSMSLQYFPNLIMCETLVLLLIQLVWLRVAENL